jgi:uncharacterized membrane protein (UPF0136 family)
LVTFPLRTATTFPSWGFLLGGIGNDNAAFGLVFFLDARFTRMRSPNGLILVTNSSNLLAAIFKTCD